MQSTSIKPKALAVNVLPHYDASNNTTGCCPNFNPDGWDGIELKFEDKLFAYATTKAVAHIPINMGKVFGKTFEAIEQAGAQDMDQLIVLSHDKSPWSAEHYFTTTKAVPGLEMTRLSGTFRTKVYEGPYKEAKHWLQDLIESVGGDPENPPDNYFFYTTCPKCARAYGKNYIVGVVRTDTIDNRKDGHQARRKSVLSY